ncbi:MAG TPA: hypothetical protein ENH32_06750 [Proteobacteria bacterium]|nr:cytochrome c biogenesis protein Ccs1 [bacterium BMS3Abin14]HDL53658.1 hypothetical protein [Pseudomonadota bacterium]
MKMFVKRLASLRLTLAVMLLFAAAAAAGTFMDIYHSWWFRGLLLLLSVNMLSCMVTRLPAIFSSLKGDAALRRRPLLRIPGGRDREQSLVSDLTAAGYRRRGGTDGKVFSRGAAGYVFTIAGHLSLLVIMASAMIGSYMGFIGTQRVPVGDFTDTYFNWKIMADAPLPFRLSVIDFKKVPNPVALKIGVRETKTGRKGKVITTHVSGDLKVPGLDGRVRILSFDVEKKILKAMWVKGNGDRIPVRGGEEVGDSGLALVPVAFAAFPEKQASAQTAISRDGSVLVTADIEVNHPLRFEGLSFYMTDYGTDPFGHPYVGYQIVKDPARIGVWAGCVFFLFFMTASLFVKHRCVVLVGDGEFTAVHLSSRGDRERAVDELKAALSRFIHLDDAEGFSGHD